jgi:N-acetylmuramoyl-L-alanine amidase
MGLRLAESIRAELASLGSEACLRPLAISILRETRMPAVQVELAIVTDPIDADRLRDDGFAARSANAIANGVERFLGSSGETTPTAASA